MRLGHARGPSAAARTDLGAGRCGHMSNFIPLLNMRCMHKIDRKGGGVKRVCNHKIFIPDLMMIRTATILILVNILNSKKIVKRRGRKERRMMMMTMSKVMAMIKVTQMIKIPNQAPIKVIK